MHWVTLRDIDQVEFTHWYRCTGGIQREFIYLFWPQWFNWHWRNHRKARGEMGEDMLEPELPASSLAAYMVACSTTETPWCPWEIIFKAFKVQPLKVTTLNEQANLLGTMAISTSITNVTSCFFGGGVIKLEKIKCGPFNLISLTKNLSFKILWRWNGTNLHSYYKIHAGYYCIVLWLLALTQIWSEKVIMFDMFIHLSLFCLILVWTGCYLTLNYTALNQNLISNLVSIPAMELQPLRVKKLIFSYWMWQVTCQSWWSVTMFI